MHNFQTTKYRKQLALLILIVALLCSLSTFQSHAQIIDTKSLDTSSTTSLAKETATGPHIRVSLLSEKTALVPGQQNFVGVLLQPDKEWHTYWQNPGDSGEPPVLEWQVSANDKHAQWLDFGDVLWPIPKAIPVAHLVNYGYEGENLLMVPIHLASEAQLGDKVEIVLDLSWLVCKEDCIPGWATLSIELPIKATTSLSKNAQYFENTRARLPASSQQNGSFEVTQTHIVVEIPDLPAGDWTLFPTQNYLIDHAASQQWLVDNKTQTARVLIPRSAYFDGQASQLVWLVSNDDEAFYLQTALNENVSAGASTTGPDLSIAELGMYLTMAFVGGLILNLMPCVLPVLSIKAMALQQTRQAASHKLAYLLGVVACFNLFALIVVLLQQSGEQVGWGFHMQEPIVVVLLAFLFVFIAMVLFDTLHVSSRFSGIGQSLVSGNSAKSHFATGGLAVIVASPCTAPFMAAALGIAFISPVYVTFLIFNALAIGFALPVTLLFMSVKVQSWLPKPGAWMETFKRFLGFPMLATVVWLVWVYAGQVGTQAQFVLLLSLIGFCMFLWLLSKSTSSISKGILYLGLLISFSGPIYVSLQLSELSLSNKGNINAKKQNMAIAFDPDTLKSLKNQQQVVVVNMTADWCITCKVNEQLALSTASVTKALSQDGVHYMVGDWTNKNAAILSFLSQYERAGVPLYVVYAGTKNEQILPQILSPNIVIQAIETAKQEIQNVD
jgi:thiol:disulfide interchange protein DsbD